MTDLIPRDAAIAAVSLAIWKSPIKAQISTIDASNDTAEALRAIPTIDPAAIREAALREAADYHKSRAEDELSLSSMYRGGSNPWFEHMQRAKLHKECATAILALIGEKK
jgi:hypothetical protein